MSRGGFGRSTERGASKHSARDDSDNPSKRRSKKSKSKSKSSRGERSSKKSAPESGELLTSALDDLKRSGLDRSDFKKLKLEILDRDATDAFVGEPRASYRIPYFDLKGNTTAYSRVRFLENFKKKTFNSKGRDGSFRYSQPFNSSPHVYLPPYFDWAKIAKDPAYKILITEGEKKAAAACKQGIPCIALGGVYGYKSQKRGMELLPELEAFQWNERAIEICYDADVMMKAEVRQALSGLAMIITQSYAPASLDFVFLDAETAGPKTGLDDYLVENGSEEFEKIPRQPYKTGAKIALLNTKICFVRNKTQFFDIETGKYFKNFGHLREAYMNEGEEYVDGKRTVLVVDLWVKSATRRTVTDVVYNPGVAEVKDNMLNLWKPSPVLPKKQKPGKWLELVNYIMRGPEYADWFLKWLAYPVQHPGAKLFQAPFVYGKKQGIGKTFVVDPVMEFIYGDSNFHRLGNSDVTSVYNEYVGCKQMVVTNEIYLPDFSDRRAAMGTLKDMITREKVTVNEKFQPRVTYADHCNYYFSSNHADALILEPDDRRFFVIEAPDKKWDQATYRELDDWLRKGEGASVIMHYLKNLDLEDFDPKGDAMRTPWRAQLISLSKDALGEFSERLIEDVDSLLMVNGSLPDLQLFRASDLLKIFEMMYPKYRFNVTVNRMGRMLDDPRIEKRKVRINKDAPEQTLYALLNKDDWHDKKNRDWAEHYTSNARQYGGKSRH